jgi:transposase
VHGASTALLTLLACHRRRGRQGSDSAGVLEHFAGTLVHDEWAPYRSYSDAIHALCGAHHLRELLAAEQDGQRWAGPVERDAAGSQVGDR